MITLAIPNRNGSRYLRQNAWFTLLTFEPCGCSLVLQDCCSQEESVGVAEQFRSNYGLLKDDKLTDFEHGLRITSRIAATAATAFRVPEANGFRAHNTMPELSNLVSSFGEVHFASSQ
jgi:hypothetical protein